VTQHRSTSGPAWIGVATAGLLLGHWAAYVLAYRQVRLRDVVLATTGHSYLAPAGKLAFVLAFVGLAWLGTEACKRAPAAMPSRFGSVALRMIGVQLVGFSALEVVERMMAHAPVVEMFGHYTYVLGLLMQVLTALSGALIVLLLTRTVRRAYRLLTSSRRSLRPRSTLTRPQAGSWLALRRGLISATGVRGPPQPSSF
jgi:hypothetical protein